METPCPHSIPGVFSSSASSPSCSSNPFSFSLWGNPSSSLPISTCFAACLAQTLLGTCLVVMPCANLPVSHSSLRPWDRARPLMRTLWEPCDAAGRRTSTCCAPSLLWLLTTTTHSHSGRESPCSCSLSSSGLAYTLSFLAFLSFPASPGVAWLQPLQPNFRMPCSEPTWFPRSPPKSLP